MKLRKGDSVVIISGPEKGATGIITRVLPEAGKVIVDGRYDKKVVEYVFDDATGEPKREVTLLPRMIGGVMRHRKARQSAAGAQSGGVTEEQRPIESCRVALLAADGKPVRIGYKTDADGKKIRIGRRAGKEVTL